MARKRSRSEARKRIRDLPDIPVPPLFGRTPIGRAVKGIDIASREVGKTLVRKDPLNRLQPSEFDPFGRNFLQEAVRRSQGPSPPTPQRIGGGGSDSPAREIQTRQQQEAQQMNTEEAIMQIVNDPRVILDEQMVEVINNPDMMFDQFGVLRQIGLDVITPEKKKRRRSKYQIELGKQLKLLKKKHPRTPVTKLMKKAHRATRKALKM